MLNFEFYMSTSSKLSCQKKPKVWRNIAKLGLGTYTWYVDDEMQVIIVVRNMLYYI